MTPEQLKDRYGERIVANLNGIRIELLNEYIGEGETIHVEKPWLMDGDGFSWWMLVQTESQKERSDEDSSDLDGIDIRFDICESEEYDGTENGVNFSVDITTVGGEIIGGMTPFNYTDDCWVSRDDEGAIEERFSIMERADPVGCANLIIEWLKKGQS